MTAECLPPVGEAIRRHPMVALIEAYTQLSLAERGERGMLFLDPKAGTEPENFARICREDGTWPFPGHIRSGLSLHATWETKDGDLGTCMLACDDACCRVWGKTRDEIVADHASPIYGYEVNQDWSNEQKTHVTQKPNPHGQLSMRTWNHFTKNVLMGEHHKDRHWEAGEEIETILYNFARYARDDGTVVCLLAAASVDVAPMASAPCFLLERHLANVHHRVTKASTLEGIRSIFAESASLLAASGHAGGLFDQGGDESAAWIRLDELSAHSDFADPVLVPAAADDDDPDAEVPPQSIPLIKSPQKTAIASDEALLVGFRRDDGESWVPASIVRARFVAPLVEIASVLGDGRVAVQVAGDRLEVSLRLDTPTTETNFSFADDSNGPPLARRLLALEKGLDQAGLGVGWHVKTSGPFTQSVTATLIGASCLKKPAACRSTVTLERLPSDELSSTRRSPPSPTSVSTGRTFTDVVESQRQARLVVIDSRQVVAQAVRTCAERHFDFDGPAVVVVAADQVAGLKFRLPMLLREAHRVVCIFGEYLYTYDEKLDRVAVTATELRKSLLNGSRVKAAHADNRLVFVAYSSAAVGDPSVVLSRSALGHTPRNLLDDVVAYLAAVPAQAGQEQQ